jgi:hypothetical protein
VVAVVRLNLCLALLLACAVHAKGPSMFEIPVIDRVLKVSQFYSARDGSGVIVTFSDLPQECLLSSKADDFGKSLAALAESWRKNQPVHVKMRGAGEIVSVAMP